jgi:hypothetical protein
MNLKVSEEYYHPIIFFTKIKNILFDYFRMIGNSKCMITALIEYKDTINKYSKKPAQPEIKNHIDQLLKNTVFIPFFSKKVWGLTIQAFNISFINIDIFSLQKNFNSYPDYIFLFYFVKFIISFLHESIGHNFKIYESFNENLQTPFNTPRIQKDNEETQIECGYLIEFFLINSVAKINIEHALFLLNENNWELDHNLFLEEFKKISKPNLENCLNHIKKGRLLKRLINQLNINKKSIENAINGNIELNTFLKEHNINQYIMLSQDEKHNICKGNQNERICRTHLYY